MYDLVIRKAEIADAEVIVAFNKAMAYETESKVLSDDIATKGVLNLLENPEKGFYVVAVFEGKIIGSLLITTEWSDWRNGTFWWIQSVYIKPEFRRKGVYTSLHNSVKKMAAKETDVCGFRLYVEENNKSAQATYLAMGMQKTNYQMFEEITDKSE